MVLADNHPEQSVKVEVGYIDSIEGLRGVAVLWVVCFHYMVLRDGGAADPWNAFVAAITPANVIVSNGYLGVDLFFLITGFLLILPWARHREQAKPPPAARDFYVRRLRRIVPAYYVQLVVLFVFLVPILKGRGYVIEGADEVAWNALAHATFLHFTTPLTASSMSINGVLWSLAVEVQYYLVLPLLAPLVVRAPLRSAAALFATAVLWRWLAQHDMEPLVRLEMAAGARWDVPEAAVRGLLGSQLPGYLSHFAIGILAGLGWYRWRHRPTTLVQAAIAWLAALLALGVLYWLHSPAGPGAGDTLRLLAAGLLGIAMFALVSRGGPVSQLLLGRSPLLHVGRISYSVYLYHLPLLLLWNRFPAARESWLSLPAYLGAVFLVSALSYRFVEAPFRHAPGPSRGVPGQHKPYPT